MFVPKSGDITSQTLALNPNTTDFQGLWHEGRELTGGTDYTLSGDQLTLTASHPHTADRRREHGVKIRFLLSQERGRHTGERPGRPVFDLAGPAVARGRMDSAVE
ncbi:X2-like carbohydrate binding domain-containing protein [Streptomyces sp. NBC_00258]|uniref:X2-like carbohydrate binding domain-containing protein n=1 Tax=Streptomyces sp. NBC_00258 TaxID=2903642 RepID=UPI002E2B45C4|nr:X2-like carbohydrate binding domain-containing protein [Streptomyces sp. NBC_00258]